MSQRQRQLKVKQQISKDTVPYYTPDENGGADDSEKALQRNFKEYFTHLCKKHEFEFIPDIVPRPQTINDRRERKTSSTKLEQGKTFARAKRPSPGSKSRKASTSYKTPVLMVPSQGEQPLTPPHGSSINLSSPAVQRRLSNVLKRRSMETENATLQKNTPRGSSFLSTSEELGASHTSLQIQLSDQLEESPSPGKEPEQAYTTFLTTPHLSYFKPCIQVEQDVTEDSVVTREVYIRGWRVTAAMMEVLTKCWAHLPKLSTLHLWNVALDCSALTILAEGLRRCPSIRILLLDGNPLQDYPVSLLLFEGCPLTYLSLRFCRLTDLEVYGLACRLQPPPPPPMPSASSSGRSLITPEAALPLPCLTSLVLSDNSITDVGAGHLATALRTNRSLRVLNLSSNQVGDEGARMLAQTLLSFPLTHNEVLQRRRLQAMQARRLSLLTRTASWTKHIAASRKEQRLPSVTISESPTFKPAPRSKKSTPTKKKSAVSMHNKTEPPTQDKPRNQSRTPRKKMVSKWKSLSPKNSLPAVASNASFKQEEISSEPLLGPIEMWDGQPWVKGNRALLSLNLARNKLGPLGVRALLDMVIGQIQTKVNFAKGLEYTGLRRLHLHRNLLPDSHEDLVALNILMAQKDAGSEQSTTPTP